MRELFSSLLDEIICASDFEYGILAQCGMLGKFGKLSQVYQQLLAYSDNTNEFYILPPEEMPRHLLRKTFSDVCAAFLQTRNSANPLILVGLVRNGEVILNPKCVHSQAGDEPADRIQETDGLIVMAYDKPDLSVLAA